MPSVTVCTPPIVSAVKKADDILGLNRVWRAANEEQQRFLGEHYNPDSNAVPNIPDIQSIASHNVTVINQFLADRGFSIALDPFVDPEDFGCASVLDLLVQWLEKGSAVDIIHYQNQNRFAGVRLGRSTVKFFRSPEHSQPLARIATKGEDLVYITILDNPPNGFDLVQLAENLEQTARETGGFSALHFPKVNLNQGVDIGWLKNMRTTNDSGDGFRIAQALQQTKLRMNEEGARVESAVAIGVARTTSIDLLELPPMIVDRPFLVWFRRPGLNRPLFVGHIVEEDWKDPGTLGDKKESAQESALDPWQKEDQLRAAQLRQNVERYRRMTGRRTAY